MEEYLKDINKSSKFRNDYNLATAYHQNIKDFDPMEMVKNITGGVIAIVAPTGSGKTVLLKDILFHVKPRYKTKNCYLLSRTAKLQEDYKFFPKSQLYDDYNEELVGELWNNQVKNYESNKGKLEPILIILDDVIASKEYQTSKMLNECAYGARHLHILIIILSQNMSSIKLCVRNNIRVAFAFQLDNQREREKFVQSYLAADNNGVGNILFKLITENKYNCIVVNNYKNGQSIDNKVNKYVANPKLVPVFEEVEENNRTKTKEQKVIVNGSVIKTIENYNR